MKRWGRIESEQDVTDALVKIRDLERQIFRIKARIADFYIGRRVAAKSATDGEVQIS